MSDVLAPPHPSTTRALFRAYRETSDPSIRERLILSYAPLVKFVVGRVSVSMPAHVDDEDLLSYGLLGLLGAVERYDPDREAKFETYAITRIRGAIMDELRSNDWVPRSVRARAKLIERTIRTLTAELERTPTDSEVAAKLGITVEEFDEHLADIGRAAPMYLDAVVSQSGDSHETLVDKLPDETLLAAGSELELRDVQDQLAEAITALPERERLLVTLYYYENLTLREIGQVLGVTESRASQLHTKAMLRLRAALGSRP
jgi:RNA polymerase sigma factor for flagellar operon FliA